MDRLFLKEKTLSEVSEEEEFHRVLVKSMEKVQSRKVFDLFLEHLEKDKIEKKEIVKMCKDMRDALGRMSEQKKERVIRKLNAKRLFAFILAKRVSATEEEKESVLSLFGTLKLELEKSTVEAVTRDAFSVDIVGRIAETTENKEVEVFMVDRIISLIKEKEIHPKQEYIEKIAKIAHRYCEDAEFMENVRKSAEDLGVYEKNNPAKKIIMSLVSKETCPCEHFVTRGMALGKVSPFKLTNIDMEQIAPFLICAMYTLGGEDGRGAGGARESRSVAEEKARGAGEGSSADAKEKEKENAAASTRAFRGAGDEAAGEAEQESSWAHRRCGNAKCKVLKHPEYVTYYQIHKIRIDTQIEKLVGEMLSSKRRGSSVVSHAVLHLKKYRTLSSIKHVIGCIIKIEAKNQQADSKDEVGVLLKTLQHYEMSRDIERYILGVSKSAYKDPTVSKIVLSLNILYHVESTPDIGVVAAHLSDALLKMERSSFTSTVVHAVAQRHRSALDAAKDTVFEHFLFRTVCPNREEGGVEDSPKRKLKESSAENAVESTLESLALIYGKDSVERLLAEEKYHLSPRLWQIGELENYYRNTSDINIVYLVYLYRCRKDKISEKHVEDIRNTIEQHAAEAFCIVYTAVERPERLFEHFGTTSEKLTGKCSLVSILFTAKRVIEDKIVPQTNCIFLMLQEVVKALFGALVPLAQNDIREVLSFLINTRSITGSERCRCEGGAIKECRKESFWSDLIRAAHQKEVVQYKYAISSELTEAQISQIEKLTGEDKCMYYHSSEGLEAAVTRIPPYLELDPFFVQIAVRKIAPYLLAASEKDVVEHAKKSWGVFKSLILQVLRMHTDAGEKDTEEVLSLFGVLVVDALEEEEKAAGRRSLSGRNGLLIDMEHRTVEETIQHLKEQVFIPMYYETLDDIILYILQEVLKKEETATGSEEKNKNFTARLQRSKYFLETGAKSEEEAGCSVKYSGEQAYRRGISHREFLFRALTKLSLALNGAGDEKPHFLKNTLHILDAIEEKRWAERHTLTLLQMYLNLTMFSLRATNLEAIRETFAPVFLDVSEGSLVDSEILRTVVNSSLCFGGVFKEEELQQCADHLQDRGYKVWLLERRLKSETDRERRDGILTELQKSYLEIKEKEAALGVNAVIHRLSPANLAAEVEMNNGTGFLSGEQDGVRGREAQRSTDEKYKEALEERKKREVPEKETDFQKEKEKLLVDIEKKIRQWTEPVSLRALSERGEAAKSYLADMHILRDCRNLREKPLPEALEVLRIRRGAARTFEALKISSVHSVILSSLPVPPENCREITEAQKDALLFGIKVARKAGKYELAERLSIRSAFYDDWRVFYEKAQIHLAKKRKGLAKQALQRLVAHSAENSRYNEKAVILGTEIEGNAETYTKALQHIRTDERLYYGYGKYLEKRSAFHSFMMFCRSLALGGSRSAEIIPKLIHYLSDADIEAGEAGSIKEYVGECVAEFKKTIGEIDAGLLKPHYMQVITRLSHKNGHIEEVLGRIAKSVIERFPGEALWKSLSILNSTAFTNKAKSLSRIISSTKYDVRMGFSNLKNFADLLTQIGKSQTKAKKTTLTEMLQAQPVVGKGVWVPCGDFTTEIDSIEEEVAVFSTLQKPKKIRLLLKNGVFKSFLCKSRDDLRKDARFMELSALLNSLFRTDDVCRLFSIRMYTVVPITPESGVIEYLEDLRTLRNICEELYAEQGVRISEIYAKAGNGQKKLGNEFMSVIEQVKPVFSEFFIRTFVSPAEWLRARKRYTITYAVMNGVGYLMGLGDRHCENILFDCGTGETVHVDLNCIFDKGQEMQIPEVVPFRLTQNITDAFGPTKTEGLYRHTLERTMRFLSQRKDLIGASLLDFVHDPLGEWTGRSNTKTAMQIIQRTQDKIEFDDEIGKTASLIEKATDPKNLAEMFIGWLAFV